MRRARRQEYPYVYVVVLTVKSGRLNYLEAMKAGADDFMSKPFDREELQARLEVARRMVDVQREAQATGEPPVHLCLLQEH